MTKSRRERLAGLLCRADLALELCGAVVDELELGEVRVKDAHDLGDLSDVQFVSILLNILLWV